MLQDNRKDETAFEKFEDYNECPDDGVYFRENQKAKMINGLFYTAALVICMSVVGSCLSQNIKSEPSTPIKKETPKP